MSRRLVNHTTMALADVPLTDGWREAVDDFIYDWADEHDLPSLAVSVTTREGEAHAEAFGSRNLAKNDTATPDTLYGVGSVTKSFTACAVMQQVEDGSLALEDSPADHTDVEFDGVEEITIHDLLCHASGLPSLAVSEALIARQAEISEAAVPLGDREDFYHFLSGVGDELDEQRRYMYCNSAYMLLADTISAITDRPFAQVVEERILEPLHMTRSTMDATQYEHDDNTMTPYRREDKDDGWVETPTPIRELSQGPGGLFTSVRELGRYLQMYLDDGGGSDGSQVLEPSSIEAMVGGYTHTPLGQYGYGWRTRDLYDVTVHGHGGSIGVATAYAGWAPDAGVGIALACNAAPDHGLSNVGEGVLAIILGHDPADVHGFFAKHQREQYLSGTYHSYRGVMKATVEPIGQVLQLTFTEPLEGSPLTLIYDSETDDGYRYLTPNAEDGSTEVTFEANGSGGYDLFYDRWRLHQQ